MHLAVPAAGSASDYIIGEGDTLAISVWGVDRLNFEVIVRPDGMITVPGLGELIASGSRPKELQLTLSEKLKDLVKNPIVTVTVTEITNSKVFIFGSGVKAGIFELNRKATLLHVLCSLGDLKAADLSKAYLVRNGKKVKENFSALFTYGDIIQDIAMESNDAIFIPLLQERVVYVIGEVATPKAIEYREGVTVMEVILEAGGFSKFASLNDISIVRKVNGKDTIITIKAKKLLKDADISQNVKLKVGDYIIVNESYF